jgi:hypothetical protein
MSVSRLLDRDRMSVPDGLKYSRIGNVWAANSPKMGGSTKRGCCD